MLAPLVLLTPRDLLTLSGLVELHVMTMSYFCWKLYRLNKENSVSYSPRESAHWLLQLLCGGHCP